MNPVETLRTVAEDLRTFADTLEGLDEGTPEHEMALQEFSSAITRGQAKVDRFAAFLRHLSSEQTHLIREADRLRHRIVLMENLERRLRDYAVKALSDSGMRKLNGRDSTLALRRNPDSVEITDEKAIPATYQEVRTTITIDKRKVMDAMKAGEEVPGAAIKPGADRLSMT